MWFQNYSRVFPINIASGLTTRAGNRNNCLYPFGWLLYHNIDPPILPRVIFISLFFHQRHFCMSCENTLNTVSKQSLQLQNLAIFPRPIPDRQTLVYSALPESWRFCKDSSDILILSSPKFMHSYIRLLFYFIPIDRLFTRRAIIHRFVHFRHGSQSPRAITHSVSTRDVYESAIERNEDKCVQIKGQE